MSKNSEKFYDVIALGELLIDFTQNGYSDQGNLLFEANPGGAPCNVLAMLNKLEKKTGFIGKVGADQFGSMLKKTINQLGIDASGLIMDKEIHTTLAFVHTAEDGDRDFSFYRNPGADMMLRADEIKEELLADTKIFHYGTLSMTDDIVEAATKKAIEIAKANKAILSFDPNLRKPLWASMEKAKEKIIYGISKCDILKISEDELEFVTTEKDIKKAVKKIRLIKEVPLICVTLGKNGSIAFYKEEEIIEKGLVQEKTIDTTGAGDTFCASILNYILEHGIEDLSQKQLTEMLRFANAAASIVTTRRGALGVMPSLEEVLKINNESNT